MKKKYEFRSNLVTFIKSVIDIILISLHRSVSMNTKMIAFIAYLIEILIINNYIISLKMIYNIIITIWDILYNHDEYL